MRLALLIAAAALIGVGLVPPRWGTGESAAALGRDVIIVLDLSRSMLAEDVVGGSRAQAAIRAAEDLVRVVRTRGGDRVAVVVFAARPHVLVPLTTDYDHVLLRLESLDPRSPPPEVRPDRDDAPSGTRIGAAIQAALKTHDSRFPGFQNVVLFTDADDPASDEEWRHGIAAARAVGIPIHVVGLGDPDRDTNILRHGEPLEGPDGFVTTRLREPVANTIAHESRGEYIASRTKPSDMATVYRDVIEGMPQRDSADDRRPQPRNQSAWFFAAAVVLLFVAWRR